MAVKNSLQKKKTQIIENAQTAVYESGGQRVELSPEIVREYMVSGNKEAVTIQEIVMFMNLCKASGLNPWAREAYCIKYGTEPATMVIGKEAYLKRAEANENFDGFESGVICHDKAGGEIAYREGCFVVPGEEIVGGWAKVYRKDRSHPYVAEVSFDEYAAKKKTGEINGQWAKKPGTMIRKVALVQALREAFPSSFGGAFAEEGGEFVPEIQADAVEVEATPAPAPAQIEKKEPAPMPKAEAKEPVPAQEGDFFA